MKDILRSVCVRIDAAIDGRSGEIELDTRFEKIGGGPGWQLILRKRALRPHETVLQKNQSICRCG